MAPSGFFVSVASKGFSVSVSGLESTLADWYVSVDSKEDGCPVGCGSGRPTGARGRPGLAPWMGAAAGCWVGLLARLAKGCWAEGLTRPAERIALREWDESCRWSMRGDSGEILRSANPSGARKARYAQDDRRGQRVKRVFVESPLMSEMGQGLELEWLVLGLASGSGLGLVVDLGPHPSEDGPLPAERIRRSWGVKECVAMGPVVGFGEVASGEWRVTSLKTKQIPRCARNDNSRGFRRAEAMA